MDRLTTIPLRIGDWRLDPQLGQLTRDERIERLDARALRLLVYLANRAGETVSIEELLDNVWSGVVVTQDSVYQAITMLRRMLGDDARQPSYIVTVPRLGYRLIAPVSPWPDAPIEVREAPIARPGRMRLAYATALGLLVIGGVFLARGLVQPPAKSVAVLPFLDLTTQAMKEEYFADGLTEELIHRLSKLPGFEVPAPTASYYFKGKKLPTAEIGRQLDVRYLLDGSLRESGGTLRISARLVRASDAVVVWSETYDRPDTDRVTIQDDIAGEVATAITKSVR